LRELGYLEGKNIVIEYRYAGGSLERLRELAAELVRLKVDVIVTTSSAPTRAAKEATATIPIVMAQDNDPVGNGCRDPDRLDDSAERAGAGGYSDQVTAVRRQRAVGGKPRRMKRISRISTIVCLLLAIFLATVSDAQQAKKVHQIGYLSAIDKLPSRRVLRRFGSLCAKSAMSKDKILPQLIDTQTGTSPESPNSHRSCCV
jgi:hypothetical protein